ncbi:hypothetical protein NCF85_16770 (plasmid) [Qipengyuania citrea]|uniref:Uncharacterized protein n=1 Tax=Qipengyuania citrea TaxID=225971 RepID=A0ABY4UAX5_9SPHN|nr:hypothetical protein [Qipengyuania citrea]USA63239.1 hypothetical protein NCF85_16770 [Qipengyuania citrea]
MACATGVYDRGFERVELGFELFRNGRRGRVQKLVELAHEAVQLAEESIDPVELSICLQIACPFVSATCQFELFSDRRFDEIGW